MSTTERTLRPPFTREGWRALRVTTRRLILTRTLRSVAQGALVVDFVLYLRALHWSAQLIGLLLMAQGLVGAGLIMAIGLISDRVGRKPFLLIYQAAMVLGTAAVIILPIGPVLVGATILLGYGRGARGAPGPFDPAEQAWLAQEVRSNYRGQVFSLNAAGSFFGMGIGSLAAAGVPLLAPYFPGSRMYLPVFAFVLAVSIINFFQIVQIEERHLPGQRRQKSQAERPTAPEDPEAGRIARGKENRFLFLLAAVNTVNAIGMGLFTPLLPLWFADRFGVGPSSIGLVFVATFFVTGVASLVMGELSKLFGLVRSVFWIRLLGVASLFAMLVVPNFLLASLFYLLRSMFNRSTAGARQAFGLTGIRDKRRGFASSLNAMSFRLPNAIGPAISGWLIDMGSLNLPFFIAGILQLAFVFLFGAVFRETAEGVEEG